MRSDLPDPASAPELFEGVLTRRVIAFVIDSAIMTAMTVALSIVGVVAGFLTFGLAWVALPFVIVFVLLAYYAVTLGSHARATIGMAAMDLVLTPTRGAPLDGWRILIHPLVFWITVWIAWPFSLLIALLTPRREMVQDLVTGTLMLRRSPMQRHWRGQAGRAGTQA
ncbi:RDD family protein [Devosia sp.]|uniref:RDD family protein n=1 Tax=Devosia sp. TaxID=1871048 RepID=UPI002F1B8457